MDVQTWALIIQVVATLISLLVGIFQIIGVLISLFVGFFQVIGVLILFFAVIVYGLQLWTMHGQLKAEREASKAQNMLSLINFLQSDDVRDARLHVINILKNRDFNIWDDKDKKEAGTVASSYGVAGIILQTNLFPTGPILENWGMSITNCYKIVKPYVYELRKPTEAGPDYWKSLDWIYLEACKAIKKND